jgi:hypothetical protein
MENRVSHGREEKRKLEEIFFFFFFLHVAAQTYRYPGSTKNNHTRMLEDSCGDGVENLFFSFSKKKKKETLNLHVCAVVCDE